MNASSDNNHGVAAAGLNMSRWKLLGLSFLSGLGGGTPLLRHPDERIAATSLRWAAVGGSFMSIALAVDIIVRTFVLRQDPHLYMDIAAIWLVNLFLVAFGTVGSGVPAAGASERFPRCAVGLLVGLIALEVPAIMWLMGEIDSVQEYVIQAILAGSGALVTVLLLRLLYQAWERRSLG